MDIKDHIIKEMSKSLHELITREDFKKNDKNAQIQSIEMYFKNILEDGELPKDVVLDTTSQDVLNDMYDDYVKEDRRHWVSSLLFIVIASFFAYTVNNIFNLLPNFSFLEAFGCSILLLNIYAIYMSYNKKQTYL